MKNAFFIICLLGILAACDKDDKDTPLTPAAIHDTVLTQNLSHPWEILWGPDDFIWMTERGGRVSRVNPQTGAATLLIAINDVKTQGEGGLLGMALHPSFVTTPHVFVAYNYDNGGNYREKIVRYSYNGTTLTDPVIIFDHIAAANIHNGCRLVIIENKLYISTGDAANQSLPQDMGSVNGKVLRLNLDGTIPADNPITGSPVWSYGHRNAQGLVYANNRLYSSEHGPDSDDEVNIIEKGRNYGWPNVRGFCDGGEQSFCSTNGVREPLKAWTPTIAVSGMDYYDKDLLPQWKHSLLVATLKNSRLMQLKLNSAHDAITETNEFLANKYGRMRDVCISPDGKVYVCTGNGNNDKIVVITAAD